MSHVGPSTRTPIFFCSPRFFPLVATTTTTTVVRCLRRQDARVLHNILSPDTIIHFFGRFFFCFLYICTTATRNAHPSFVFSTRIPGGKEKRNNTNKSLVKTCSRPGEQGPCGVCVVYDGTRQSFSCSLAARNIFYYFFFFVPSGERKHLFTDGGPAAETECAFELLFVAVSYSTDLSFVYFSGRKVNCFPPPRPQ